MSGTEFIVAAIICVLFGCTCYWLGYGYGKDEGITIGKSQQKERYAKTLDAYQSNLSKCQHDLAFRDSAIDAMRAGHVDRHITNTASFIDLTRHRGKEC